MNDDPFESQPEPLLPAGGNLPPWMAALRDLLVFQGKLFLDWGRDLILAPVAVVALLAGLVTRPADPGYFFYRLMTWGRVSDRFIGLFSAGAHRGEGEVGAGNIPSLDDLVGHLENVIVTEHQSGELSAKAKARINEALEQLDARIEAEETGTANRLRDAALRVRNRIKDGRG